MISAVFFKHIRNYGLSGDNADESILVIYYGDKILGGGPFNQVMHGGGDTDGNIVLPAGDLHDPVGFCLAYVHIAHILQGPQQVALRKGTPVFTPAVEYGQGGETGGFHFFQSLAEGIVII